MNNDYKPWRQGVEVEEEAKSPAVGKVAELEQEYKRVVWMSMRRNSGRKWLISEIRFTGWNIAA